MTKADVAAGEMSTALVPVPERSPRSCAGRWTPRRGELRRVSGGMVTTGVENDIGYCCWSVDDSDQATKPGENLRT